MVKFTVVGHLWFITFVKERKVRRTRITSLRACVASLSVWFCVLRFFTAGILGRERKKRTEGGGERTFLSPLLSPFLRFFGAFKQRIKRTELNPTENAYYVGYKITARANLFFNSLSALKAGSHFAFHHTIKRHHTIKQHASLYNTISAVKSYNRNP